MVTPGRPEKFFLFIGLVIVLALLYDLSIQYAAVPSTMRYVPPENVAYVVTSPLRAIWISGSPHVKDYFAGPARENDTEVRKVAQELKETLDKKGIVLSNVDDLAVLGIDAESNAAAVLVEHRGIAKLLVAIPVADRAKFVKTLEKFFAKPAVPKPLEHGIGGPDRAVYMVGENYVGFGDDGAALLADDIDLLRYVLDTQLQNLNHFRSSDRYSNRLAALLPGTQGRSNAWLRGSVPVADIAAGAIPLLTQLEFVIEMDARQLAFEGRSELPDGRSELISRMLAPPQQSAALHDKMLNRTDAAVSFADLSLPYYLRYASSDAIAGLISGFSETFPGLLEELRDATTLSQIGLAISDPSERVPGVILGLRMSPKDADDFVFRLQTSLRLKRDREILRQAMDHYQANQGVVKEKPVAVAALLEAGLLTDKGEPLWERYRFENGQPMPRPELGRQDFINDSYLRRRGENIVMKYIMPPFTDDDLAYRFAQDKENIQIDELKSDEYRLCSGYHTGILWLGNNAEVLGRWIERTQDDSVSLAYQGTVGHAQAAGDAKLMLLVFPRHLLEAGQLYPDSKVNKMTREYLSDLGQYRAARLVMTPYDRDREVGVSATLVRH